MGKPGPREAICVRGAIGHTSYGNDSLIGIGELCMQPVRTFAKVFGEFPKTSTGWRVCCHSTSIKIWKVRRVPSRLENF